MFLLSSFFCYKCTMNELKRLAEFEEVLEHYTVSTHGRGILADTKLLLMCGVTSSGRNTVIGELLKTGNYHFITSDTTRKPRVNRGNMEISGEEYWFKTEKEVLKGLKEGEYLEAAIIHGQQVSGISIAEMERARDGGKIATTDIEIVGVRNIVQAKPDSINVFMIPPSFEVWIDRINGRGHMPELELRRRLKSAISEIREALHKDYFVIIVNDEFHKTAQIVSEIFEHEPDQQDARQVARRLLNETQTYLATAKS